MRISDWSSDVCSSDLQCVGAAYRGRARGFAHPRHMGDHQLCGRRCDRGAAHRLARDAVRQIGRASCREECVSTCRSRWSPYHYKKTKKNKLMATTIITDITILILSTTILSNDV